MLNSLRASAGSWIVKIFLGLLALSFAAWGVQDIFTVSPDTAVAKVGDVEIGQQEYSRAFQRGLQNLQQRFGGNLDAEQARQFGLADQVLDEMIDRALYDQATNDLALTIGDDIIRQDISQNRAFQNSLGKFDAGVFEQTLRQNGYSEQSYVAARRRELVREQLFQTVTAASHVPKPMLDAIYRYQGEQRVAETIAIAESDLPVPAAPADEVLVELHEARATRYMAPEYRAISYIVMQPETLADEISVSDEDIAAAYEERLSEFTVRERREVEQILVTDQATAEKIADRLGEGGDFYAVAKALADQDADAVKLGEVQRGDLPEEVEATVFQMAEGDISAPVQSDFGWHVFRIVKLIARSVKPLAEVRDDVERGLRIERAGDALFELTNKVDDVLGGGGSLEEVAGEFDLKLVKLDAVNAAGLDRAGQKIDSLPKITGFLRTAFQVEPGLDPLLQEVESGYYLVRVDRIDPPALQPFAEIRERVLADWQADQRRQAAQARAEELAEQARGGAKLVEIAKDAKLTAAKTTDAVTRQDAGAKADLGPDAIAALFKAKLGDVVLGRNREGTAHLVLRLKEIKPATPGGEGSEQLSAGLQRLMAQDLIEQLGKGLRAVHAVEIDRRVIDLIFDQQPSQAF